MRPRATWQICPGQRLQQFLLSNFSDAIFGRIRHRIAAKFANGVVGRALLRLLLASSPSRRKSLSPDLCRHLEALAMIGAFLVHEMVGRRHSVFALRELLEERLVV